METVAVLGGGQLGLMLGLAGIPLGLRFRFLDPSPDAPAAAVGPVTAGALDDPAAALSVAGGATVVTYEWEGVAATTVESLTAAGTLVHPGVESLAVSQDRLAEKQCFRTLGIPHAEFARVDDETTLRRAIERVGLPAVLKTRRGGYDGKGQALLQPGDDPLAALARLPAGAPMILEAFVPFERELSIVAVRGRDGEIRSWPLVENRHQLGILRTTTAPADVGDDTARAAEHAVQGLLDSLGHVGVLALELFQVGDALLANEFAPRVHNSGHWTIEGAATSQFENHLRAVLGWPLGATHAVRHSAMINCIGVLPDPDAVLGLPGVHLHRYGKALRTGRKVGHVTVTAGDPAELSARVHAVRSAIPADDG